MAFGPFSEIKYCLGVFSKAMITSSCTYCVLCVSSVEVRAGVQVLYGHTARVWDARLLPGATVVSIGEDATCRVWVGCVAVRTVGGHRGRSLWSMAVDSESKRVVSV